MVTGGILGFVEVLCPEQYLVTLSATVRRCLCTSNLSEYIYRLLLGLANSPNTMKELASQWIWKFWMRWTIQSSSVHMDRTTFLDLSDVSEPSGTLAVCLHR